MVFSWPERRAIMPRPLTIRTSVGSFEVFTSLLLDHLDGR